MYFSRGPVLTMFLQCSSAFHMVHWVLLFFFHKSLWKVLCYCEMSFVSAVFNNAKTFLPFALLSTFPQGNLKDFCSQLCLLHIWCPSPLPADLSSISHLISLHQPADSVPSVWCITPFCHSQQALSLLISNHLLLFICWPVFNILGSGSNQFNFKFMRA